jgi:hypothetical protein
MGLWKADAKPGMGLIEIWLLVKAANQALKLLRMGGKHVTVGMLADAVQDRFPHVPGDVIARVVNQSYKEAISKVVVGDIVRAIRLTGEIVLGTLMSHSPTFIRIITPDEEDVVLTPTEVRSLSRVPDSLIRL